MDLPPAVPFVKLHAEFFRNLLGMKFDCVLSNSGSSTGVIEDIVLVLDNADTHDRRKYVPAAIVDEEKFTTQMSAPDVSWVKSPFHPISIPGNGSVTIPILFLLSAPTSEDPKPGHHKVTPYLRESNSDCWNQQRSFHINLQSETVDAVKRGTKTAVETDELDKYRDQIQ